jgi:hypothetical protein
MGKTNQIVLAVALATAAMLAAAALIISYGVLQLDEQLASYTDWDLLRDTDRWRSVPLVWPIRFWGTVVIAIVVITGRLTYKHLKSQNSAGSATQPEPPADRGSQEAP